MTVATTGSPDPAPVGDLPGGLSAAEAQQRLQQCGHNELPEEKRNPLFEFFSHFWGPIPWMIEAAAILSAGVRHWADFIIITVLLLANAVVGFWEEYQAGNAIAALKATLALKARVKRDGEWQSLPARELVPGDLIRLRMGDVVPADATLAAGDPIEVDQSALTGESLPVERKKGETAYSGSIVKMGEIEAEGDGVNDAPALKKADAGIAVSGATAAARAAADIVLLTPGLSVIIDAIKESRRIFQRMNSYAMYRIAETIRVLLFMTLSILVFNFYPVTAVMIVLLALLNDGAILSIAYDRVHYSDQPEAWNMRLVLGIASVLGIAGVVASFGLFYLGERVFHLDRPTIQTLIYLKLSVAGHLTIFVTRTRGPFWSHRPAPILLGAVIVTQLVATVIAACGIFMKPIGWEWSLVVWLYALAWFFVNDRIKLAAYRIFQPETPLVPAKA